MRQTKWLWSQMKAYRKRYIFLVTVILIPIVMQLINPLITQMIVDQVVMKIPQNKGDMQELIDKLIKLLLLMVMFMAVRTFVWRYAIVGIEECGQRFLYDFKKQMFHKLQNLDRGFYKRNETGDLMTRLTSDAEMGKHGIVTLFRGFLEAFTLYLATTIYMMSKDVLLTLALMVFTPMIFFVTFRFSRTARPYYMKLREKLSRLNSNAQENIEANRVIKAFAREAFEEENFLEKNTNYKEANIKASFVWLRFYPAIEGFSQALPIVVLVLGGIFLMNGRITAGTFLAFNSLCWTLAAPMRNLGILVNDTQRFLASVDKLIELYEAEPSVKNKSGALVEKDELEGKIEFRDVSVKLEHTDVLEHVNLTIMPGETVAVMGPTGSGKTTLINCINRFIDVTDGAVLIDNVDVRDYDLKVLRKNIGIANQDVFLFSDTINRNIAFGNSMLPTDQIERFARLARADFVWRMQNGFDTMVGERGSGLSGGQKQRLALARAIAVKPSILILDDTTSAVDMNTESEIRDNLVRMPERAAKIIIAQRYFSAMKADKIIILNNGHIAEVGTHKELLAKRGYYTDIYLLQRGISSLEEDIYTQYEETEVLNHG